MPILEAQLISWSRPLSTTEDEKCQRAVNAVTNAIKKHFGFKVTIFLQGSYRNNTNVRQDSDVDIVARYNEVFYPNLVFLNEAQKAEYNRISVDATYTFWKYKDELQGVLTTVFGRDVERKNKCLNVKGNSYRITADVVPCFPMKRMRDTYNVETEGIKFYCDDYEAVESYPEQHYNNGVNKTNNTFRLYKRMVRILKNFRNVLIDAGVITPDLISSFFIECLVYNVPNYNFLYNNYTQTLKNVITIIYNDMQNELKINTYLEVSECLFLFSGSSRSSSDAKNFILNCWQYAGY